MNKFRFLPYSEIANRHFVTLQDATHACVCNRVGALCLEQFPFEVRSIVWVWRLPRKLWSGFFWTLGIWVHLLCDPWLHRSLFRFWLSDYHDSRTTAILRRPWRPSMSLGSSSITANLISLYLKHKHSTTVFQGTLDILHLIIWTTLVKAYIVLDNLVGRHFSKLWLRLIWITNYIAFKIHRNYF